MLRDVLAQGKCLFIQRRTEPLEKEEGRNLECRIRWNRKSISNVDIMSTECHGRRRKKGST